MKTETAHMASHKPRPEFHWRSLAKLTLATIEHSTQSSTNMQAAYLHAAAWRVYMAMAEQRLEIGLKAPPTADGIPAIKAWIEGNLNA